MHTAKRRIGMGLVAAALVAAGCVAAAEGDAEETAGREAVLLTDFSEPAMNARWEVVNDNVMGGRSEGRMSFVEVDDGVSVMRLSGVINTDGGGFTSVRMLVDAGMLSEPGVMEEYTAVRLRVRALAGAVGRPFALRLEDDVERRLGINFRAVLPLDGEVALGEWQTVEVSLEDLWPTHHGRALDAARWAPLEKSRVNRLGIMLNDTGDGPYEFEVERIELVRPAADVAEAEAEGSGSAS